MSLVSFAVDESFDLVYSLALAHLSKLEQHQADEDSMLTQYAFSVWQSVLDAAAAATIAASVTFEELLTGAVNAAHDADHSASVLAASRASNQATLDHGALFVAFNVMGTAPESQPGSEMPVPCAVLLCSKTTLCFTFFDFFVKFSLSKFENCILSSVLNADEFRLMR